MSDGKTGLEDAVKLIGDIQHAHEELKKANEEALSTKLTQGDVDTLVEQKMERINSFMEASETKLDKLAAAQRQRQNLNFGGDEIDGFGQHKLDAWARGVAAIKKVAPTADFDAVAAQEYKTAFDRYLRKDHEGLSAEEQKALSVGNDVDGGFFVLPDTSGRTVGKVYETSPMEEYASVANISTDSMTGMYDQDEVDVNWVSEMGSREETSTATVGRWNIPVHELAAMPKVSRQLLDDAAFDVEGWLMEKVDKKCVRVANSAFVNGDGVGRPRGFLTYADGTTNGTIEQYTTGVSGGLAADPDGMDKLLEMMDGLKEPYHANAHFFSNGTTNTQLRLVKDSNGRYMWQPSVVPGVPPTLLGHGVVRMQDMASVTTANALCLAFGDMAEHYQIVKRMGTSVLRDPFSAKPFILFYATRRVGGDVINFEAMKLLKSAT